MKCQSFLPPSSRLLFAAFTATGALLSSSAQAANYDSLTTTSYNWSTTTAWSPTAPTGGPGAGDTANLLSVGVNRTVIYDANATGIVGSINITENAAFQNYLEIQRSLAFTNITLLNSAASAAGRIRLFNANTLDINTGSSVTFGATTGTVVGTTVVDRTGTAAGSVNIAGGTLTAASPTNGVTQTVIAPVNMTAGLIDIQSVGTGTTRLALNQDFSASGGTIQFSGTNAAAGSLYLSGSNITIGSGVTFTGSTSQVFIGNSSANQAFSIGTTTVDFALRNATTTAGTSTIKTVTSTAPGNAVGSILLQNGANASGTNVLGFTLGSNLSVASGKSIVAFSLGTATGTQNTIIDLNGFTYDGTAAASTAFAPANNVAGKIQINSASAGGTFRAGSINLSGSDITVGANTTLQATGTAANNLGLIASGTGTINAGSRFLYTGTAATLTSSRAIGILEVGSGNSVSNLTLASSLTSAATGNAVIINNQGILTLGGNTLTLNASGSPVVAIAGGGTLAAGNAATGLTASQVAVSGRGIISTSSTALTPSDFALNLFSSTSGTVGNSAVFGLTAATTISTPLDLSGSAFQNVSIGAGVASGASLSGTAGQITPNANTYRIGGGLGNISIQGALLSGAGNNLVVSGGGVNVINSSVSYTGTTTVEAGGLLAASADRFTTSSGLIVNGTGTFDLSNKSLGAVNTTSTTFRAISGNGTITNSDTTVAATLTVNGTSGTSTFSGALTGSALGFSKTGASTLVLSGTNTYGGTTSVTGGTLLVNGNNSAATGAVTVATGATLGGAGSLGGATTVNGQLSVGANAATPGLLTFTSSSGVGALTLAGTTVLDLNGTSGAANRGLTYDAVNVTGALVYGGALTLNANSALATGATYDLFDFGSASGTFSSITIGDGSTYQSSFDYSTGVLTITPVPEPSTLVGGTLMLTAVAWHLRRRRPVASRV